MRARKLSLALSAGITALLAAAALAAPPLGASGAKGRSAGNGLPAFYSAPRRLPRRPGVLLRAVVYPGAVPAGAWAWRILYTTRSAGGAIVPASGVLIVPAGSHAPPHPVIAWAHPATGVARRCAPSLLGGNQPFYGGLPSIEGVLREGWALVEADNPGLGTSGDTPFLVGRGEGRALLDAVRALRAVTAIRLSGQTVVWGDSQGGQAALWAGIIARSYAPDVPLSGVAAMAPPTALGPRPPGAGESPVEQVLSGYTLLAYARAYPDVRVGRYVEPGAMPALDAVGARCLEGPDQAVSYLEGLNRSEPLLRPGATGEGALATRLAQNVPDGAIPVPLLIAQGLDDDLVRPAATQRWVAARCAAGQSLEYRTYAGRGHTSLGEDGSPLIGDLLAWTRARFAAVTAPAGCAYVSR